MYTNKLQQVLRNSKILHMVHAKQFYLYCAGITIYISISLHVYKQAATSSQEFQDPCTWFMQNNSVFTVQELQSISTPLHVYKQAATGFSGVSKIPAHGPLNVILCTTQMQQVSQESQGLLTWSAMQSHPSYPTNLPRTSERRPREYSTWINRVTVLWNGYLAPN